MHKNRLGRWGVGIALLGLLACHRASFAVVEVDVSTSLWPAELSVGTRPELQKLFEAQLAAAPALRQVENPEKLSDKTPRYQLVFTPTLIGTPENGGAVIATVLLRREQNGLSVRYPVEAQERFEPSSTAKEVRGALEHATAQAVAAVQLQISALEAPIKELHRQLESKDPRARGYALARLAELRDPVAAPALKAALKSDDLDEVRRAVGGLVSLGDPGAVPALIEATHHRTAQFQREVIYALGELGGPEAQGYLYTVSEGADLEPIRAAAHEALQELEARAHPKETSR